jgi:hypothetical protein
VTSLPKPPTLEVPPPSPAALEALDAHLSHLVSRDAAERETAVQEILEAEPDRLLAIHRRLSTIADASDHSAMKDLLTSIRERTRQEAGKKPPDYLEMLEMHARPDAATWRDLVAIVSMSRMLRQIATVAAARELIGVYARFGEFLRVDTQLQLEKLGDRSIAALIEAERHPAPKIAHWASRQLDALGKAIPGAAVETSDPEVLADILRAYGRARDPDAARLVISFANSERTQIREAARQAVVLMGEVSNWQLRDTYENVVGKKPPREWSWERTARELFGEFDRMRLSRVHVLFEEGLSAERAGKLDNMAGAFDQVLAQSPVFERASEMVPGYFAYAKTHADDAPDKAIRALRRVERIAEGGSAASKPAESLLLTLEAKLLLTGHVADQTLVRRALDLDPGNARARALMERISHGEAAVEQRFQRYLAAAVIAAAAFVALLVIALRRRPSPPTLPPENSPLGGASGPTDAAGDRDPGSAGASGASAPDDPANSTPESTGPGPP